MYKKNVLLLNPPGEKVYIRDFYCSKTSKSGYLYTPVDFIYIYSYLKDNFNITFLDCILEKISVEDFIDKLQDISPTFIITLTGYISWIEDFILFKEIKIRYPDCTIIGSGDILFEKDLSLLFQKSGLDAILYDFSSSEIEEFINRTQKTYAAIAYRDRQNNLIPAQTDHASKRFFRIPVHQHEIFPLNKYQYPFVRHQRFATVITDFACPFKCIFCIMSKLHYRSRTVDNILEELHLLKKEKIKEIYFADQTFGVPKKATLELLEKMDQLKFNFGWVCFTRIDLINDDFLFRAKKAGCHTMIFGIEFGNDQNLEQNKKKISTDQIRKAILLCKKFKIRTVGTFLMGLPEQTESDIEELILFSTQLNLDFASFNIFVPRGSDIFTRDIQNNEATCYDQSGNTINSFSGLPKEQLIYLHKKANKKFYLRFAYILKRCFSIKSLYELKILIFEGLNLLISVFKYKYFLI
jgi:anaerobic magnesium-protoporphyrin IX monomethyl ester cyclase